MTVLIQLNAPRCFAFYERGKSVVNQPLSKSIMVRLGYFLCKQLYCFWPSSSTGVNSKMERICSARSKFFPLRVDPMSNSIQRYKQEFMQIYIRLIFDK